MELILFFLFLVIFLFLLKELRFYEKELFDVLSLLTEKTFKVIELEKENEILKKNLNDFETKVGCIKQSLGGKEYEES